MMTAVFSCGALSAFSARSRSRPGQLSAPKLGQADAHEAATAERTGARIDDGRRDEMKSWIGGG